MLSPAQPDRIHVAFDGHRLVANAGLLLPVTLAQHLGLVLQSRFARRTHAADRARSFTPVMQVAVTTL